MAQIDEERLLVKVSLLIRDTASVSTTTFITPQLIADTEAFVATQLAGVTGLIVEVTDITGSNITLPTTPAASYSVSTSANTVSEGNSVTFTVTTTNVLNGTNLYWTTTGTVANVDLTGNVNSGSFTITDNTASVVITPSNDTLTEGDETFALQIRTDSVSGTVVATSANVTISDTSLNP